MRIYGILRQIDGADPSAPAGNNTNNNKCQMRFAQAPQHSGAPGLQGGGPDI